MLSYYASCRFPWCKRRWQNGPLFSWLACLFIDFALQTTLQMLTGDTLPTSGVATVNKFDVVKQLNDVRREMGYCPREFDCSRLLTDDFRATAAQSLIRCWI